jgi:DnaA family protein
LFDFMKTPFSMPATISSKVLSPGSRFRFAIRSIGGRSQEQARELATPAFPDRDWEIALFDFYNRARARDCALLIAADAPPRALQVGLADLRSRLAWGVVFQLARASDEDRAEILRFRAGRRGPALTPEVAGYIVHRAPRGITELLAVLDRLDRASLTEQRAVSIPFVKRALAW